MGSRSILQNSPRQGLTVMISPTGMIGLGIAIGLIALCYLCDRRERSKRRYETENRPITHQPQINTILESTSLPLPSVLLTLISEYAMTSSGIVLISGNMFLWPFNDSPRLWPLITAWESRDCFSGVTEDSAMIHHDYFYWLSIPKKSLQRVLLTSRDPLLTFESWSFPSFPADTYKYHLTVMDNVLYVLQGRNSIPSNSLAAFNLASCSWKSPIPQPDGFQDILTFPSSHCHEKKERFPAVFLVWGSVWGNQSIRARIPDLLEWTPSLHSFKRRVLQAFIVPLLPSSQLDPSTHHRILFLFYRNHIEGFFLEEWMFSRDPYSLIKVDVPLNWTLTSQFLPSFPLHSKAWLHYLPVTNELFFSGKNKQLWTLNIMDPHSIWSPSTSFFFPKGFSDERFDNPEKRVDNLFVWSPIPPKNSFLFLNHL